MIHPTKSDSRKKVKLPVKKAKPNLKEKNQRAPRLEERGFASGQCGATGQNLKRRAKRRRLEIGEGREVGESRKAGERRKIRSHKQNGKVLPKRKIPSTREVEKSKAAAKVEKPAKSVNGTKPAETIKAANAPEPASWRGLPSQRNRRSHPSRAPGDQCRRSAGNSGKAARIDSSRQGAGASHVR